MKTTSKRRRPKQQIEDEKVAALAKEQAIQDAIKQLGPWTVQGLDNLPANASEYKAALGSETYLFNDVSHWDRRIGNCARAFSREFGPQRKKLARF